MHIDGEPRETLTSLDIRVIPRCFKLLQPSGVKRGFTQGAKERKAKKEQIICVTLQLCGSLAPWLKQNIPI
jgi:hypothetical protein